MRVHPVGKAWLDARDRGPRAFALLLPALIASAAPAVAQDDAPDAPEPAADPWQGAAAFLPAEAALFASVRLPEAEDGFAFLDLLTGLYPALGALMQNAVHPLALPSWGRGELKTRGLDPDTPLLAALGQMPAGDRSRTPLSVHQGVLAVSDRAAALAFVGGALARYGFEAADPGGRTPAWWKPWQVRARRAGTALAARDGAGRTVAIDFVSATLMRLTLATPVRPLTKKRDIAAALKAGFARLLPTPTRRDPPPPLASTMALGARRLLASDASFALVLAPTVAARLTGNDACRDSLADDKGAFFHEAAVVARLHPFNWRLEVAFAPAPDARAVLDRPPSNDGLVDTRQLARAGLAALALYTPSWAALTTAPRPAALADTLAETLARTETCGPWAWPSLVARHWPRLVALALADATRGIDAGPLADARNLAAVIKAPAAGGALAGQVTWLLSFAGERRQTLDALVKKHGAGLAEATAFGERTPTLVPLSPATGLRLLGLEPLVRSRIGLALSALESGLGWYYGQPRLPAVYGRRGAIGSLHVNIGHFLELSAEDADPGTRDAVRLAASQVGLMGGPLTLDDDGLLRIELALSANDGDGLAGGL